MPTDIPLGYD